MIESIEVPGLKRDNGMGDIAGAVAIAAAAVERVPSPRDPAPAPPSDEEDESITIVQTQGGVNGKYHCTYHYRCWFVVVQSAVAWF